MKFAASLILSASIFCGISSMSKDRIRLQVLKHQRCGGFFGARSWLSFPSSETAPLRPWGSEGGCYKIEGQVQVRRPIADSLQVYINASYGRDLPGENCYNWNPKNGCGGWGSCLYCDACQMKSDEVWKGRLQLQKNGRRLQCKDGLDVGSHQNISLSFCLPSKDEFLRSQGVDPQLWDQAFDPSLSGVQQGKIGIFLTIYLFNRRIDPLMKMYREWETEYRQKNGLPNLNPIPATEDIYTDFNNFLKFSAVGCHRIYGNVFLDPVKRARRSRPFSTRTTRRFRRTRDKRFSAIRQHH